MRKLLEAKTRKLLAVSLALALLFTSAVPVMSAGDVPVMKEGAIPIVEVQVQSQADLDILNAAGLDIIAVDSDGDTYTAKIMVHEFERDYFAANNVDYVVVQEDATVQVDWPGYQKNTSIASYMAFDDEQPIPGIPGGSGTGDPGLIVDPDTVFDPAGIAFDTKYGFPKRLGYRRVTEYYGEMNYLAKTYPDLVKLHVLGESWEGRPLIAMEISSPPGVNDGRPESVHIAGNHSREWPSNEYCMNLAWHLLTQYGKNNQITKIIDTTKVWLMPLTNPDGQHWDQTNNPGTWRRNRRVLSATQFGVDLNRNYAYDWGSNNGSSSTFGSDTYRGPAPFSEPETQAIRELYTNNQVMTAITGHTWGELIQYPWSYDTVPGHPALVELGRELSDICLYGDQISNSMYYSNGGHCDYVFATAGTLSYTFEHGSFGFIRPYMGENRYGLYGAIAPYKDFNGSQRRIPLTYPTATAVAAAGAPAQDITAEVVLMTEPFATGYGDTGRFATVAKVQELGDLTGKILMTHKASSNALNASVAKAAQDAGAVAVIFSGNTATGTNDNTMNTDYYIPDLGTTGDALLINIPIGGTLLTMCREYAEHVRNGGENKLTITSTPEPGNGSIYYHWEKLVGAFLYNIEAAHTYVAHINGKILDGASNNAQSVQEAALDLSIDVNSQIREANGNPLPAGTHVDTRRSHMDAIGGTYDWSVTPSVQPHFENEGYAITASANGRYSQTKTVVVSDYKKIINDVNFVLPDAVTTDFNFDQAWSLDSDVTVPFSTYTLDAPGQDSAKGVVEGVSATVNGQPVTVTPLGNGDFTATFNPKDLGIDADAGAELVIDFEGGLPHSAYTNTIQVRKVQVKIDGAVTALGIGKTMNLSTNVTPSGTHIPDLFWTTSNPRVVEVSENGVVTAVGPGSAQIMCTSVDGKISLKTVVKVM